MNSDDKEDEVEVVVHIDSQGQYVARAFHKASGTIKLSDAFDTAEEATDSVMEGIRELVKERRKGLGEK